jgi:phosphotransferase system  glucose/maltose/N-acetylglucosamine-specific IIC component
MPSKSTWAKIFGWAQFGLNTATTVATQPGAIPHGFAGWTGFLSSLLLAVGMHHASNTGGTQ